MHYMRILNRLFVVCMLLVISLVSCKEETLFQPAEGEGMLVINGVSVDVSVSDGKAVTRAAGTFEAPDASELTYTLRNEDNGKQLVQKGLPEKLTLDVGHYSLAAVYGTEAIGAEPYLAGAVEFDIRKGETTVVDNLDVTLKCAIIRPAISEELLAHYQEGYRLTVSDGVTVADATNGEDIFVPAGKNYTLDFSGVNMLGESSSFSFPVNNAAERTRYVINCNPDLPSFTLPAQAESNAWSRRIYITPMTADNILTLKETMTDKILSSVKYEASADGSVWTEAVQEDGRWVIKGLQPSTTYTLRARFGGVTSTNTQQLVTEASVQLENAGMENWTSTKLYSGNGTWSRDLYCEYCTSWSTRNERTNLGAEGANSGGIFGTLRGSGYGVWWRWYSGTIATTDAVSGNAAEISTLAFYNKPVSGIWGRGDVYNYTRDNGTAYAGYLFTGSFDKNSDTYTLGIPHGARPSSVSFDYKYVPTQSDQCIAYAKVYDASHNEIASTEVFNSAAQESYTTKTLVLNYTSLDVKAAYIAVFFQSGTDLDISHMNHVEGGYSASPFNQDRIVGSVLKVDNVTLNYE